MVRIISFQFPKAYYDKTSFQLNDLFLLPLFAVTFANVTLILMMLHVGFFTVIVCCSLFASRFYKDIM
jgi:hypothetical protein